MIYDATIPNSVTVYFDATRVPSPASRAGHLAGKTIVSRLDMLQNPQRTTRITKNFAGSYDYLRHGGSCV